MTKTHLAELLVTYRLAVYQNNNYSILPQVDVLLFFKTIKVIFKIYLVYILLGFSYYS